MNKLGMPFKRGKPGLGEERLAEYSFPHLMELSIILGTRFYRILPEVVARALISFRGGPHRFYGDGARRAAEAPALTAHRTPVPT